MVTLRRLHNLVGEEASLVARHHAGDWSLLSLIAVFAQEDCDINGHTLCLGEKVMSWQKAMNS